MKNEPSEMVVRAWIRLLRARQAAMEHVETALKDAGLPPWDWYDALWELDQAGEKGLRPLELERAMLIRQYGLSRLLDRIEKAGFLKRQPCEEDGRGQIIVITKDGRKLRQRMWRTYAPAINRAIAAHVSEDEAKTLGHLLGKLVATPRG